MGHGLQPASKHCVLYHGKIPDSIATWLLWPGAGTSSGRRDSNSIKRRLLQQISGWDPCMNLFAACVELHADGISPTPSSSLGKLYYYYPSRSAALQNLCNQMLRLHLPAGLRMILASLPVAYAPSPKSSKRRCQCSRHSPSLSYAWSIRICS